MHVVIRAPAKLNLFLEILRRRDDGYHEIDTVMLPINCYDTLVIRPIVSAGESPGIQIATHWWPSRQHWQDSLGGAETADELLSIPSDHRNLIHRAITATAVLTNCAWGFDVQVRKRIPAGAGMGGASSDAAAAIRATAALTGVEATDARLWEIAAQIGSDVPFFFGDRTGKTRSTAMRATGRGERLAPVTSTAKLRFIVVYPATSLSTALVYRNCTVPPNPHSAEPTLNALLEGGVVKIGTSMHNRLSEPATKISAMVSNLLEQMWRCGLPRCQLTGSGSACFSILDNDSDEIALANRLRAALNTSRLYAHIITAHTTSIPQPHKLSRDV